MNKRGLMVLLAILLVVASLVAFTSMGTFAQPATTSTWTARLTGYQEVSPKFTGGTGTFTATLSGGQLTYTLTTANMVGTITGAQISFGTPGTNGGILVFLCGNTTTAARVACPAANGGTITGTLSAADVQSNKDQNITSGDFNALTSIIANGAAYVNVTTARFPDGELRGAIMLSPESGAPTAAPTATTAPATSAPVGAATPSSAMTAMPTP